MLRDFFERRKNTLCTCCPSTTVSLTQAKRYSKAYCKYSIVSLRKTITPALESATLESMQKHFRKVRHYMFAYLEGIPGGSELEELVKKYKKEIMSHRRISEVQ